jgi:hypothetical protein
MDINEIRVVSFQHISHRETYTTSAPTTPIGDWLRRLLITRCLAGHVVKGMINNNKYSILFVVG